MATTEYNHATEREIIAEARDRVREAGTVSADPADRTIVVLGYLAALIIAGYGRKPPQARLDPATVLARGGPWAVVTLLALALLDQIAFGGALLSAFGGG